MDDEWDWLYRESGRLVAGQRKHLRITQSQLAEQLGMSRASIANIEAGKQRMQLHLLFRFARVLGVSPYGLVPSLASASKQDPAAVSQLRMSDELWVRELIDTATLAR